MPKQHFLDASLVRCEWNNAIPPRMEIDPGDTVGFATRDAGNEFHSPQRNLPNDVLLQRKKNRMANLSSFGPLSCI